MNKMAKNFTEINVRIVFDADKLLKENYSSDGHTSRVRDRLQLLDEYMEIVDFSKATNQVEQKKIVGCKKSVERKIVKKNDKTRYSGKRSLHKDRTNKGVVSCSKESTVKQDATSQSFGDALQQIGIKERLLEKREKIKLTKTISQQKDKHKSNTNPTVCKEGQTILASQRWKSEENSSFKKTSSNKNHSFDVENPKVQLKKPKKASTSEVVFHPVNSNLNENNKKNMFSMKVGGTSTQDSSVLLCENSTQDHSLLLCENYGKGSLESEKKNIEKQKSGAFGSSHNIVLDTLSKSATTRRSNITRATVIHDDQSVSLNQASSNIDEQKKKIHAQEKIGSKCENIVKRGDSIETTSDYGGSSSELFSDDDLEFDYDLKSTQYSKRTTQIKSAENLPSDKSQTTELFGTNFDNVKQKENNSNSEDSNMHLPSSNNNLGGSKTNIVDIMTGILNQIDSRANSVSNEKCRRLEISESTSAVGCTNTTRDTIIANKDYRKQNSQGETTRKQDVKKLNSDISNKIYSDSRETGRGGVISCITKFETGTHKNNENQNQAEQETGECIPSSHGFKRTSCNNDNFEVTDMELSDISDSDFEQLLEPGEKIHAPVEARYESVTPQKMFCAAQNPSTSQLHLSQTFDRNKPHLSETNEDHRNHKPSYFIKKPVEKIDSILKACSPELVFNNISSKTKCNWLDQAKEYEMPRSSNKVHYDRAPGSSETTRNNLETDLRNQNKREKELHKHARKSRTRSRSPLERSLSRKRLSKDIKPKHCRNKGPRKDEEKLSKYDTNCLLEINHNINRCYEPFGHQSALSNKSKNFKESSNRGNLVETVRRLVPLESEKRKGDMRCTASNIDYADEIYEELDEQGSLSLGKVTTDKVSAFGNVSRMQMKKRKYGDPDSASGVAQLKDQQVLEELKSECVDYAQPTVHDTKDQIFFGSIIPGSFEVNGKMKFETDYHIKCFQLVRDSAFKQVVRYSYENFNKYAKQKFLFEDELIQQLKRNFERYLSTDNDKIEKRPRPRFITAEIMIDVIVETWKEPHVIFSHNRQLREFDDVIGYVGFKIPCYWCELVFSEGKFLRAFPVLDPIGHRNDTMYCQTEPQKPDIDS